jgi:LuxR family transcriptional regulator, maltose regulon positive regulatory protein
MASTLRDSRVTVPRLPPRYVSRPRLVTQLDRAADLPLTLLCAGPGAGKTVLLADWVRHTRARVAWLNPTAADAEPRRFWRLLESALPDYDGAGSAGYTAPLGTAGSPGLDLLQMLFSQVPDSADQLVVIIDDAHVLTDPDVLHSLDRLVRGRQPGLRLILAARSDPLLPLHRYRLAGQMLEVRAADLAMTPTEIRQVLAAHGVSLPKRDFDILAARTEGWAAGVRLSAMRMEGTEHPASFVSQLALDPGSIGEYLVDEVLRRLSAPHRRLLIETSFLDEVTGPLADAVTGMAGCGDMLADLARDNSFVIPLDPLQTRYRYHQLFGEILRYLLQRRDGEAVRALKTRAAAWFEANDDLGSAVRWAVQAGDGPRVAALLARGGLADAFARRQDLSGLGLRELVPLISPEGAAAGQHPGTPAPNGTAAEISVANSVLAAVFADPDAAACELERIRAWRPEQALADPDLLATCDLVELILGQKAFDADAVDAAASRLLGRGDTDDAKPPATPGLRAAVLLAQASTHLWHGRHEDIGGLLDEALAEARREGADVLELEVLGMMVYVDTFWSRTKGAERSAQQAHALRKEKSLSMPPALELASVMRALIAGDLGAQTRNLQRILLPDVVGSDPGLMVALTLGQASALVAHGHEAEARAVLYEAAGRRTPPVLGVHRDIMLADLDTSLGRPRSALALLDRYRSTEFAILTATARARAYLALSDPRRARDCVRSVLTTPSAQTGRFVLVEALLCDARIAQLSDDRGRALEILLRAIELAQGEIVLPFLHLKDTFAALLGRHPDVASRWPVPLDSTTAAAALIPAPRSPRDLPEPLTQRELTILRFLATSMSTVEIADELCLSVNTVKTHLAAIYRKLPASRRRDAVLRARELELI